jgi:hypothetical protein
MLVLKQESDFRAKSPPDLKLLGGGFLTNLFPLDTDTLFQPLKPMGTEEFEEDRLKNNSEIKPVARRRQPVVPVNSIVEESWDDQQVHIYITVDELEEDAGEMAAEERNDLPG